MKTAPQNRTNNASPSSPSKPAKVIKVIMAIIIIASLGAFLWGADRSLDNVFQGEPGDGIISAGEWNAFITEQVHTIAQGEKLLPEAEKLLCNTAIPMEIKKTQARQIAGYCSGATRLLDQ